MAFAGVGNPTNSVLIELILNFASLYEEANVIIKAK